jgi:hypothetical protein
MISSLNRPPIFEKLMALGFRASQMYGTITEARWRNVIGAIGDEDVHVYATIETIQAVAENLKNETILRDYLARMRSADVTHWVTFRAVVVVDGTTVELKTTANTAHDKDGKDAVLKAYNTLYNMIASADIGFTSN